MLYLQFDLGEHFYFELVFDQQFVYQFFHMGKGVIIVTMFHYELCHYRLFH